MINSVSSYLIRLICLEQDVLNLGGFAYIQNFANKTFLRISTPVNQSEVLKHGESSDTFLFIHILFPGKSSFANLKLHKQVFTKGSHLYIDMYVEEHLEPEEAIEMFIKSDKTNQSAKISNGLLCSHSPKRHSCQFYTLNGPHKSGTTLLEACFNTNPNTLCLHENNILSTKSIQRKQLFYRKPPFETIIDVAGESDGKSDLNFSTISINIIKLIFEGLGYSSIGDRSPNIFGQHNKNIEELAGKRGKYIFISRDLLSTLLSLLDHAANMNDISFEKEELYSGKLTDQAKSWLKSQAQYIHTQKNYIESFCSSNSKETISLDYNDFLENKRKICTSLFKHLNIASSHYILDEIERCTAFASMRSGSYSKVGNPSSFIIVSSRKDQIQKLSQIALNIIEEVK